MGKVIFNQLRSEEALIRDIPKRFFALLGKCPGHSSIGTFFDFEHLIYPEVKKSDSIKPRPGNFSANIKKCSRLSRMCVRGDAP